MVNKRSIEEEKKLALAIGQKNPQKVIKIQAIGKGMIARKKYKLHLEENKKNPVQNKNEERVDSLNREDCKLITNVPDYSNPATRATEAKLGAFHYDQDDQFDENDLIDRGPYELDNGAIYKGQWSREGLRYGRGIQIWVDGSKYEGYWRGDMANGMGRLIHADGDVYEGEW
mmetsp:Transcript_27185/g.27056  ORF Transcript_27185/g.27056 Transcript_27185/m.27056 type:complete len:172 (+) Transcript_27185:57-572(+)